MGRLTFADDPCILTVVTIINPPAIVVALPQTVLKSITVDVVHPDGTNPSTKRRPVRHMRGNVVAELLTHNLQRECRCFIIL